MRRRSQRPGEEVRRAIVALWASGHSASYICEVTGATPYWVQQYTLWMPRPRSKLSKYLQVTTTKFLRAGRK